MVAEVPTQRKRILMVDDDVSLHRATRRLLRKSEFDLETASDGHTGLEMADAGNFDLVLLDLAMPGLNGLELALYLLRRSPQLPVVIATGDSGFNKDSLPEQLTNVKDVLPKPWRSETLIEQLRGFLETSEPLRTVPLEAQVKILVVEDNPGDLKLVERFLKRPPLSATHVVSAARLSEAKKLLEQEPFSVVILDLTLPDASGLTAVVAVREITTATPIIVLSGAEDETLALSAMKAGVQDYLVKGWTDSRIIARSVRYALERKWAEERLVYLTGYDQLTSLMNRGVFQQQFNRIISTAERREARTALFSLNLEGFRRVNDAYGHEAGDRLLRSVALALRGGVRGNEVVSRLAGDEFAVVVEDLPDEAAASVIAQRLLSEVNKSVRNCGYDDSVSAHLGIALYPDNGRHVDELVKAANSAMRIAAGSSDGYQFYDEAVHEAEMRRVRLERQLRSTAANGHFHLLFEPQFDLRTRKLTGCEALLRMPEFEGAFVGPDVFVPILEKTGLIKDVGEWVLGEACRSGSTLLTADDSVPLQVSVNLSPTQFQDPKLVERVVRSLLASGFPAERVELEITESTLMENRKEVGEMLQALKHETGVRIAIDDFGTGYSSLAYLKDFPVDTVKIDRLFVSDLHTRRGAALCAAIIQLARSIGMKTVGEGIENSEQLMMLIEQGCDVGQGHFLGRPMPSSDLKTKLGPQQWGLK